LGAGKRTLVEARPFIDVASLLDDGACATNGGLYLAVEGQGDGVQASPLSATGLGCANPGQFRTPSGDFGAVTAATPDLPAWSGGGIGSPGVVKTASSLHLFFDATTDPRELDTNGLASLSFAVGHARRGAGGDATWATETPANASRVPGPVPCTIGTNSCGTVSVRDPSPYYGAPENLLAFARERTSGGNPVRGRYAIDVLAMGSDLLNTGTTRNPLATPTYASNACASLRDPAVVPSPPDGADRYWLFFTCIPGIGKPDIRAVRLRKAEEGGFVAMGDEVVVADAESLGPFAGAGVFDPEVLLDADDAEGPLYRLWFLARDTRRTKTSVGLAQWRVRKDEDPAFSTYPGNPVLTDADAVLAPCEGKCALTAWSVTRRDASTLLFGLARTVNRTEDVEYRIEFLEQTWAAPGGGVP
ncbi:MAG: hypothetical protein KC656_31795, partial [Myxococcales bacterium]|nr:hypothetical protein [Myxococcales bacterium]